MAACRVCAKPRAVVVFAGVGTFLSVLGIILAFVWPPVFKSVLKDQLKIENGTQVYDLWSEAPIPIYLELYFFNLTNPAAVQAGREKPNLVEVGPYFYEEHRKKVNVAYNGDDTVDFEMQRYWTFIPGKSVGLESDEIMALNVVAATAAAIAKETMPFFEVAINGFFELKRIPLFHKKTIRELMFAGYSDPIIDFAEEISFLSEIFHIPFDKFGWFYPRNGSASYDGVFTMDLGQKDLSQFGQMVKWNGTDETTYYPSYCGKVNGSAGELFPPFVEPQKLSLFITDICRSISMPYDKVVWKLGMKTYQFWGDRNMLANPSENPDNWCFCRDGKPSLCTPTGLLDISKCRYGAPAFISYPHFFQADESLLESVDGLKPDPEKHKMTLAIEPTTGLPMEVKASLQINMRLTNSRLIGILRHVKEVYMPMLWFRQSAEMSESIAKDVRFPVIANMIIPPAGYALLGIGVVVLFAGAALHLAGSQGMKHGESSVDLLNDENVGRLSTDVDAPNGIMATGFRPGDAIPT